MLTTIPILDPSIAIKRHDTSCSTYMGMVKKLQSDFNFKASEKANDITKQSDFISIYDTTIPFYQKAFPAIYKDYVPLYFSLWKLRVKDVATIQNLHQDGGIHYFSKNGYASRMLTLWTNIYKDDFKKLNQTDLGIFVVNNQYPNHQELYETLATRDRHFFQHSPNTLHTIQQLGAAPVHYDLHRLKPTSFSYTPGTSIQFNSHLLHGSTPLSQPLERLPKSVLDRYRVSLTSVWIRKDDLQTAILHTPEKDYDVFYLSTFPISQWKEIRKRYPNACAKEHRRIHHIKTLITHALNSRL
ncbi:hypothetical protein [Aquimarina rhabdastrellae]